MILDQRFKSTIFLYSIALCRRVSTGRAVGSSAGDDPLQLLRARQQALRGAPVGLVLAPRLKQQRRPPQPRPRVPPCKMFGAQVRERRVVDGARADAVREAVER